MFGPHSEHRQLDMSHQLYVLFCKAFQIEAMYIWSQQNMVFFFFRSKQNMVHSIKCTLWSVLHNPRLPFLCGKRGSFLKLIGQRLPWFLLLILQPSFFFWSELIFNGPNPNPKGALCTVLLDTLTKKARHDLRMKWCNPF